MDWLKTNPKRIAIVGRCGSGKSTLAKKISKICNLPIIHVDKLYWLPNWREPPKNMFIKLHDEEAMKDQWIMDGNNKSAFEKRFERADHVIFFDFPRYLCIYLIIRRSFKYLGRNRSDMADGCYEKITPQYFNFLKYVWSFHKTSGMAIYKTLESTNMTDNYTILKSSKDVDFFLKQLKQTI